MALTLTFYPAFLLALFSCGALAQSSDPTRPPDRWLVNTPEAGDSVSSGPRLQSVLLPERGRPVAVISGKTIALGESIDGAKLVGLNERGAVLRGPEGVTYLYLAPDVEKNMLYRSRSGMGSKAGREKELP